MKRSLVFAALLALAGAASAQVAWVPTTTVTRTQAFDGVAGLPASFDGSVGTTLTIGGLSGAAGSEYVYTFTYLGQESSYLDSLHLVVNGLKLNEADFVGKSVSGTYGPGYANFKFEGDANLFAINGGPYAPGTSIGLIGENMTITGDAAGTYAFVLGYNDSAGSAVLGDWDDFVVGVNVTAVPEPETYALMLAGLGAMAFVARRRQRR